MPLRFANRVKESSVTDGTGTITLDGAYDSYQSFSNAFSDNDTTYYTIVNGNGWEVGIGTYASGTLSRDAIFSSSDSGNKLNLNGLSSVFVAYPSEKSVYRDGNNQVIAGSSGIVLDSGIPTLTDSVLYNVSGILYFNGEEVGASDTLQEVTDNGSSTTNPVTFYNSITVDSGVYITSGIPENTNNALYNIGGELYFNGSSVTKNTYQNISSDTVLSQDDDYIFVDSSSSSISLYTPLASGVGGKEIKIKMTSTSSNNVNIIPSGLETIDGQSSFTMYHNYQSITLVSNNENWFII
jgi:hypothetical protein